MQKRKAMEFLSEIIHTLESTGLDFSLHDSAPVITVSKRQSQEATSGNVVKSDTTISIIAIPVKAESVTEAEAQSQFIRNIVSDSPAVIITEDRWRKSHGVMKSRLLAHLGIFRSIYARDCEVRKISRIEADAFLEETHSYGGAKCRYCYGLFLKRVRSKDLAIAPMTNAVGDMSYFKPLQKDQMIAAAEFSNARRWDKNGKIIRSYEWIRYASRPEMHISGGMGKILGQFIKDIAPDDIMSYADLEWSDGKVYSTLGFVPDGEKPPVTFAIDSDSWTRTPLSRLSPESDTISKPGSKILYLQNLGSRKYRLKLTEYDNQEAETASPKVSKV